MASRPQAPISTGIPHLCRLLDNADSDPLATGTRNVRRTLEGTSKEERAVNDSIHVFPTDAGCGPGVLVVLSPILCALAAACLIVCGGLQRTWASTATTATTLAVTPSGNAATVASGTMITVTATVKAGTAAVTPGQVNFCDATAARCTDIHLLGTAQLTSSGTAVLKLIPGAGSHSYKAVFVGTTSYAASSSSTATLAVVGTGIYPTITNIASSGAVGNYSLAATVMGNGNASPTGTVSFMDTTNSNYVLGTAALMPDAAGLSFANSSNPGASNPLTVVTGDFNGDGIPDLALTVNFGNSLTVLLGNGDGTFAASASPTTGYKPDFLAVGDFNGDGNPDLAVANDRVPSVTVLLGNGDGTFRESQALETGSFCLSVAVGDFNGDGQLDLAVTDFSRPAELVSNDVDTISILLGNGDGTFAAAGVNPATGSIPVSIATGDFNGDGKLDLAVANYGSDAVTILLGQGDGSFTAAASPATGSEPTSLAVGDFNGDGKADLAVTDEGSNTVTILLGNGDGTFAAGASPGTGSKPSFVTVADFDGDGKPDLAVTNSGSNTAVVLLGNGDGTFTKTATASTGAHPLSVAAGDFNGDGKPDLAAANLDSNSVTVLLTETEAATATATVDNISPMGTGTHLVDANYPGDSRYSSSISAALPLLAATAALPSFALSNTPVSIASPGASGTSTITVTPSGGFTGTVALTCAVAVGPPGALNPPTCSATSPAAVSGPAPVTATLTINSTAPSSAVPYTVALDRLTRILTVGDSVAMPALFFFCLQKDRRRWKMLLPLIVFGVIAGDAVGCGSGTNKTVTLPANPGTTIGMYTVTVTGASGATMATTAVSVMVN